jgi:hypothetical protein
MFARLIEAVEQIPPECWDQPSHLEGWSLRELAKSATPTARLMGYLGRPVDETG